MRYINPTRNVAEPLISKSGVLALDLETKGLTRRSTIVMLLVATKQHSFLWDTRKVWPTWLNKYLLSKKVVKVIHNGLFDGTLIETQHGAKVFNIHDTMLQEKILLGTETPFSIKDEKIRAKFSTSLKFTLLRHNLKAKKEFDSKIFKDWPDSKPFTKEMVDYGFGDIQELIELDLRQRKLAEKNKLVNVIQLENEVLEVFIDMRVRGLAFNREKWLNIGDSYMDEYKEKKRIFDQMLKREARKYNSANVKGGSHREFMPDEINVNSSMQVKKLFALRGIEIESYTDFKRLYSMNKVQYNDKLLDSFWDMRDVYQLANTFGEKWLHEDDPKREPTIDPLDHRVHPDFTQIISTGRSSCNNPNLQQLPAYKAKALKGGAPREAFIATKGYTFFGSDYKGQEFALMMLLANETKWLEYIRLGYDTHSMLTEMANPKAWKEGQEKDCAYAKSKKQCKCFVHGQLRTYTKKIIFGKPYGKGITSIAEDLSITYDEAKPLVKAIEKVLPKTMRWMEEEKAKALKAKAVWTLTPWCRYRKLEFFVAPKSRFSEKSVAVRFQNEAERMKTQGSSKDSWRRAMIADNGDWRIKNQGVNSPIQGTGADMLKRAMVILWQRIQKEKLPGHILLPLHDAMYTECKDSFAKKWQVIVEECMKASAMEITRGIDLIQIDTKSGKTWL